MAIDSKYKGYIEQMKILEMFAGVGGFRVGLEKADKELFETKWANQFEPARKSQDALEVYNYHYPDSENIGIDVAKISDSKFKTMDADMIVGGFPCQDYSVARSNKDELGIKGKKGVLFWEIIRAVDLIKPKYLILENVDRLLKSPTKQRGRDFAIMLTAFNNLGYSVEWRVINAADYGCAQRRRRLYFFIVNNNNSYVEKINIKYSKEQYKDFLFNDSLFAKQFPVKQTLYKDREINYTLTNDIVDVSTNFKGAFYNTGYMTKGNCYTADTIPLGNEKPIALGSILQENVPEKYIVTDESKIARFAYLRGAKQIQRTTPSGYIYIYREGSLSPYEDLSLPSRTMLTSEGTVNRSTHWLKIGSTYRTLTPIEAERLQAFPDNWTKYKLVDGQIKEVSDRMRMFFMGNALVTTIIKRIGLGIKEIENNK